MGKKISVVVVNYNAGADLKTCVESVLKQKNCEVEMIICDNDSSDNSLKLLDPFKDKIKIILNKANLGFGKACNIGFKHSVGDDVFFLNPDASCVEDDILSKMAQFMDENRDYGLIGPKVMDHGSPSYPQYVYLGERFLKTPIEPLPGEVAWVIGAAMFARRDVIEKINGFDEDYFLFGEEADLCLRIRRQGWKIGYYENAIVDHIGETATRQSTKREHWSRKQNGVVLFYQKNYSKLDAIRLIKRDLKIAKRRLWMRKFFKNQDKQDKYEAIRDVCHEALRVIQQ